MHKPVATNHYLQPVAKCFIKFAQISHKAQHKFWTNKINYLFSNNGLWMSDIYLFLHLYFHFYLILPLLIILNHTPKLLVTHPHWMHIQPFPFSYIFRIFPFVWGSHSPFSHHNSYTSNTDFFFFILLPVGYCVHMLIWDWGYPTISFLVL